MNQEDAVYFFYQAHVSWRIIQEWEEAANCIQEASEGMVSLLLLVFFFVSIQSSSHTVSCAAIYPFPFYISRSGGWAKSMNL